MYNDLFRRWHLHLLCVVECRYIETRLFVRVDSFEVGDHDLHEARQVDVMVPAPLLPGQRVVKHLKHHHNCRHHHQSHHYHHHRP